MPLTFLAQLYPTIVNESTDFVLSLDTSGKNRVTHHNGIFLTAVKSSLRAGDTTKNEGMIYIGCDNEHTN